LAAEPIASGNGHRAASGASSKVSVSAASSSTRVGLVLIRPPVPESFAMGSALPEDLRIGAANIVCVESQSVDELI